MKTLRLNATLAALTLALFGCAAPKPHKTMTAPTSISHPPANTTNGYVLQPYSDARQIDLAVAKLKVGMKGTDVIRLVGIPCGTTGSMAEAIDSGANETISYAGHTFVFSGGVLQSFR